MPKELTEAVEFKSLRSSLNSSPEKIRDPRFLMKKKNSPQILDQRVA